MGAGGAIVMAFFGAMFASMTCALELHRSGPVLVLPFAAFAAVAISAARVLGQPGDGIGRSERAGRVIMWSTLGEGVGLFAVTNVVLNLGHPEMLLPAMAVVVGLHFLPMAYGVPFGRFYVVGSAMILPGVVGLVLDRPAGGMIAGFCSAGVLTAAAVAAVRRERRARTG